MSNTSIILYIICSAEHEYEYYRMSSILFVRKNQIKECIYTPQDKCAAGVLSKAEYDVVAFRFRV